MGTNGRREVPATADGRLQILLADYEQAREDERQYFNAQTALIAITLTAITVAAGIGFASQGIGATTGVVAIPPGLSDIVFAVVPMLAVVPLLFLVHMGTTAVWRSYYIRAVEREIRETSPEELRSYEGLPMLSYGEMYVGASNGRNPESPGILKIVLAITYPIVVLIVGGLAVLLVLQVNLVPLRLMMLLLYGGGAIAILGHVGYVHLDGRKYFYKQVDVLRDRLSVGLRPVKDKKGRRGSWSYFVVPRPDELLSKAPFILLGVLLAVAVTRSSSIPDMTDVGNVILLWLAVEFLIYQARYQWNDIRGLGEDTKSLTATSRGRLPSFSGNIAASWVVILIRIYAVYVVTTISLGDGRWGVHLTPDVWVALALVTAIGVAYEAVRAWARRARGPSPLSLAILYVVVGLGYPARVVIGYLAVDPTPDLALAYAALASWALGVFFVSLTWVSEGAWEFEWGRTTPTDRPTVTSRVGTSTSTKPHLSALLRSAGVLLPGDAEAVGAVAKPDRSVVLTVADLPRIPVFPIGIATASWFVAIGMLTDRLVSVNAGPAWLFPAAVVASAVVAAIPTPGRFHHWLLLVAAAPLSACFAIASIPIMTSAGVAGLLALGLAAALTPFTLFLLFRRVDYEATRAFVRKSVDKLKHVAVRAYELVSGIESPPK